MSIETKDRAEDQAAAQYSSIVGELNRGELNRGEPCRAWLEYQGWGTPWTQYFGAKSDTLCQYASHFFFGEQ